MKQHTTEQITTVGMANGENQKVLGMVELDITLANEPLPYDFIVLPYMNQEIILGSNFFKDFAGAVDYASQTVSFFNNGHSAKFRQGSGARQCNYHAAGLMHSTISLRNVDKCVLQGTIHRNRIDRTK